MEILIWIGAALSLCGVGLLMYCVVAALKLKRGSESEDEIRDQLQRLVPLNLIALLTSMMGLAAVIVGIILS